MLGAAVTTRPGTVVMIVAPFAAGMVGSEPVYFSEQTPVVVMVRRI